MSIEGAVKHAARLKRLAANAGNVGKVLFAAADIIRVEARQSITRGAVSGKGHVPSKPGEPPKADTHVLDSHITTEMTGPLKAVVRSNAAYAVALEYGTSKMAARPYMRPAVKKSEPKIKSMLAVSIKTTIEKG